MNLDSLIQIQIYFQTIFKNVDPQKGLELMIIQ